VKIVRMWLIMQGHTRFDVLVTQPKAYITPALMGLSCIVMGLNWRRGNDRTVYV
jgi:hypothetical protein